MKRLTIVLCSGLVGLFLGILIMLVGGYRVGRFARDETRDAYECQREVGTIGYRDGHSDFLWVWAQCMLARGYTVDEVTDAMFARGYSVNAVANALRRLTPAKPNR